MSGDELDGGMDLAAADPDVARLRPPFPWFGGKSRAIDIVWPRFGACGNYVEPFFGGGAILLGRPPEFPPRVETVNDKDAYLANFWRAVQHDPDAVAQHADWPVNETDLHARHRWLVNVGVERVKRTKEDPDYFDAQVAGWWVYGQCLWIGSGWCEPVGPRGGKAYDRARVKAGRAARGINAERVVRERLPATGYRGIDSDAVHTWQKRMVGTGNGQGHGVHRVSLVPHDAAVGPSLVAQAAALTATKGVHSVRPSLRDNGVTSRRWNAGGAGGGSGVHAPRLTRQQLPQLDGDGSGTQRGALRLRSAGLYDYMRDLSARLRRVRVCCGEWHRVLTPAVTTYIGVTGVLLDPPYDQDLRARCYAQDSDPRISTAVRAWALEHGDNPKLRIALCGYADEHSAHMPPSWEVVEWKVGGGYARTARAKANRHEERIWFSPHCLRVEDDMPLLRESEA